jgi:hypothetical protein
MNTGIQDAMNLGWKLARAIRGGTEPWLLDSYQGERHPVGEQVLALTDAFNTLVLGRSRVRRSVSALAVRSLLRFGPSRRAMAERLTGLGIRYPSPSGSREDRWTGRRVPDLDGAGERPYEHLRAGRFVLLDTTRTGAVADAVRLSSPDVLAVRTCVANPAGLPPAVLIRPDGYVAWAAADMPSTPAAAVAAALHWCGPAGFSPQIKPSSRPRATAS